MNDPELKMLDEALAAESGLSGREMDFITRLDREMRERELSPKQTDWLRDIADRVA